MHTCEAPGGTRFNYNSDFRGKVRIQCGPQEMWVPGEDILYFVALHYVMPNRIREVEQMSWQGLLGGGE